MCQSGLPWCHPPRFNRAKGNGWEAKGLSNYKIGDFPLKAIGPTGNLIVGCHNIPFRHQLLAAWCRCLGGFLLGGLLGLGLASRKLRSSSYAYEAYQPNGKAPV